MLTLSQELSHQIIPDHEEAQPLHAHPHPGSKRHRAQGLCALRVWQGEVDIAQGYATGNARHSQKVLTPPGLDDKTIEQHVTELVKAP